MNMCVQIGFTIGKETGLIKYGLIIKKQNLKNF